MIDAERVLTTYLAGIVNARVAGKTPDDHDYPWVRVTMHDGRDIGGVEHLHDFLVQFDCFAGNIAMKAEVGQAEASDLARDVRAALKDAQGTIQSGAVISDVTFIRHGRGAQPDSEPARDFYTVTASISMHA